MAQASVTAGERGATDRLPGAVAGRLARDGIRLAGALRPVSRGTARGICHSDLWLLPEGPLVRTTQELGAGSAACRMDVGAFEEAVGLAASRLQAGGTDLVLLNKFGLSEAEGRGFRSLIADALGRGLPVLTGVSDIHRPAFERFAEGLATRLPPEEDAILDWCRSVVGRVTAPKEDA